MFRVKQIKIPYSIKKHLPLHDFVYIEILFDRVFFECSKCGEERIYNVRYDYLTFVGYKLTKWCFKR